MTGRMSVNTLTTFAKLVIVRSLKSKSRKRMPPNAIKNAMRRATAFFLCVGGSGSSGSMPSGPKARFSSIR